MTNLESIPARLTFLLFLKYYFVLIISNVIFTLINLLQLPWQLGAHSQKLNKGFIVNLIG